MSNTALWQGIRKIRKDGQDNSQAINLGKASDFIENCKATNYARIRVERDKIIIEVLEK